MKKTSVIVLFLISGLLFFACEEANLNTPVPPTATEVPATPTQTETPYPEVTQTVEEPTLTVEAPDPTIAVVAQATDIPAGAGFILTSPNFDKGQPIPQKYACEGTNLGGSPEIIWANPPEGTLSLALIMEDPDAPGGAFIHWVVYNIPPGLTGLPESMTINERVKGFGSQGPNSYGTTGYGGPCPPLGQKHRYFFRLYALDVEPSLDQGLDAAGLKSKMFGHILAQAEWMGTYQQP